MSSKVYTKKGDDGTTALFGGARRKKYDVRIEAYGSVDELNSYLGLIRDQDIHETFKTQLLEIQDRLFTLGAILASDPSKSNLKVPSLALADVTFLENAMDKMDEDLPAMKSFVLPGGHTTVSFIHIARCICRRTERQIVNLHDLEPVEEVILQYINRLSDYLFVLSRKVSLDLSAEEIPWEPRL